LACLPKYIDAAGGLTSSAVFQSSAQWGTIHVGDRLIVPSAVYTVQAEVTAGTPIGSATASTWAWGNANNVDDVNVFDIVCALDGFQGSFANCTPYGVDQNQGVVVHPVAVDMSDVLAVLDAFSGTAYPDSSPCSGFEAGEAVRIKPRVVVPAGTLTLEASSTTVSPLETVRFDVYGDGLANVRAYQVALEVKGANGALVPVEAVVDTEREDRVFGEQVSYPVADTARTRLGGALGSGSVTRSTRVYLGSFTFRAGSTAGTVRVDFRPEETLLWGASTPSVLAGTSPGIDITVTGWRQGQAQ
jgi:hypothetical protein